MYVRVCVCYLTENPRLKILYKQSYYVYTGASVRLCAIKNVKALKVYTEVKKSHYLSIKFGLIFFILHIYQNP